MTKTPADHGADAARRDAASPARRREIEAREARTALIENDAKYGYIRRLGFSGPELAHDGRIIWQSPLTTLAFVGDTWVATDTDGALQAEGLDRDELDVALGLAPRREDRPGGWTHTRTN